MLNRYVVLVEDDGAEACGSVYACGLACAVEAAHEQGGRVISNEGRDGVDCMAVCDACGGYDE